MSHAFALTRLREAFPREEFPDRTVALYASELEHLPTPAVLHAVEALIRRNRFLPRLSEILTEIAEYELNLPTTEEAWEIANRGSLRAAHPCVRDAAEHVGGRWAILHSDNVPTVRAQFRSAYDRLRARTIDEYRTGHAAELPAGLKPLGTTMAALPETTRIRPRPVMLRWMQRMSNSKLNPPSEEEKLDAVQVLREGPPDGEPDPLYQEAERIFEEAGR